MAVRLEFQEKKLNTKKKCHMLYGTGYVYCGNAGYMSENCRLLLAMFFR